MLLAAMLDVGLPASSWRAQRSHLAFKTIPPTAGDLLRLVHSSRLDSPLKFLVLRVLKRLAQAEAKVHRTSWQNVRFHQLARPDMLINITGFCLGLRRFQIDRVYCSPIPIGNRHQGHDGRWVSQPGPATLELLKRFPIERRPERFEWTTPTAAAVVSTLALPGPAPPFQVLRIADTAGRLRPPIGPGVSRFLLGRPFPDDQCNAIVEAIRQAAHTGRRGDGKIFISAVEESVSIRTGQRGNESIY